MHQGAGLCSLSINAGRWLLHEPCLSFPYLTTRHGKPVSRLSLGRAHAACYCHRASVGHIPSRASAPPRRIRGTYPAPRRFAQARRSTASTAYRHQHIADIHPAVTNDLCHCCMGLTRCSIQKVRMRRHRHATRPARRSEPAPQHCPPAAAPHCSAGHPSGTHDAALGSPGHCHQRSRL